MRKACLEHRSLARTPTRSCRTFRHALNLLARQPRFQSRAHMLGPLVLRLAQPTDAKNPKSRSRADSVLPDMRYPAKGPHFVMSSM